MFDTQKLEELHQGFMKLLAASPAADIEKNTRAMLGSFFSRLDLVTRDEFDIQADLLAHARQKLETLEARLSALENNK